MASASATIAGQTSAPAPEGDRVGRMAISVRGVVQGVGFRPFVHGLASRWALDGFVRNRTADVLIEVEGSSIAMRRFTQELEQEPPPLARIDGIRCEARTPRGERGFSIEPSEVSCGAVVSPLAPDAATCAACLAEVLDPRDRRHAHPFAACTACGPRFTMATGAPYDRVRTTMAGFELCDACRSEYGDPANRRFHAQPIACPACGPRLQLRGAAVTAVADPLAAAADALVGGAIVAVKGVGGYHLACDARSEAAVGELRRRKHRDAKPLAVMVADVAAAEALCCVSSTERTLLESAAAPIVLLERRRDALASGVAPQARWLGVMLAYTPLHHLLLRELSARPGARPPVLVMTSGNSADEPIVHEDADARARLQGVADLVLAHDRRIHNRCDDSVMRVVGGAPVFLRRSRGHAPAPLSMPRALRVPTLALGGQLKATFALGVEHEARLSHHLGDLDDASAYHAFAAAIDEYQQLFGVRPRRLVHDLHPDYASTRYALARARREGLEVAAVQHHHAHVASCAAEHGLLGAVLGIAFDGAGHGLDGTIWGGEVLLMDGARFRRVAHLAPVVQPGGDQAARSPWRMAVAHLLHAGVDPACVPGLDAIPAAELGRVTRLCTRSSPLPSTSSVGRLFDAVAALLDDGCHRVSFEGQAASWLEGMALAAGASREAPYPLDQREADGMAILDPAPMIRAIVRDAALGTSPQTMAARFHLGLAEATVRACARVAERTGIRDVVASGGCLVNGMLAEALRSGLEAAGLCAHFQRAVPPNDGGLCFGQLAVAAAMDEEGR